MAVSLHALDDRVAISGQLRPRDMQELADSGVVAVVNNRPDGEALLGQPPTASLKQAAEAAGLVFVDLPFSGPRATPQQVRTFAELLAGRDGKIVAFCKSGMRSALLWAAAALAHGRPLDEVLAAAARAGQNLEPVTDIIADLARAAHD